jgi:putative transport protein
MDWFQQRLTDLPEVSLFLCLALGYALGSVKIKGIGLGTVVGTLIVALGLGLAADNGVNIPPFAKTVFFALFMFSTGYEVGPEFFRGLGKGGAKMIALSVTFCVVGLGAVLLMAKICGFDKGMAAGLLSGALTQSSAIGTSTDAIQRLSIDEATKQKWISHIAIGDAATYLFGAAGVMLLLTKGLPKFVGFDLREACRRYETELEGDGESSGGAYVPIEVQAFRIDRTGVVGKRVGETVDSLSLETSRICIQHIRRGRHLFEPSRSEVLQQGDVVVLSGRRDRLLEIQPRLGPQVVDVEAMDIPFEITPVVVTNREYTRKTLREIGRSAHPGGVHLRRVFRQGQQLPALPNTRIERGDTLELVGRPTDIDRVGGIIGFVDRPRDHSDVTFLGIAIALGALVGFLSFDLGSIPISLGTGGGVLLMGLLFGWLHSMRPRWGRIPRPSVWLMQTLGLNTFVAIVGLGAASHLVEALRTNGLQLIAAGIVVSLAPNLATAALGWYVFKMNGGLLVGAVCGAGTCTAALSVAVEDSESRVPALGYTVPYAFSNVVLTLWGPVVVSLTFPGN